MRIIARSKIVEYYTFRPDSKIALEDWFHKVRNAEWTCFVDIKQIFRSADSIGNQRYVFNIKGNSLPTASAINGMCSTSKAIVTDS